MNITADEAGVGASGADDLAQGSQQVKRRGYSAVTSCRFLSGDAFEDFDRWQEQDFPQRTSRSESRWEPGRTFLSPVGRGRMGHDQGGTGEREPAHVGTKGRALRTHDPNAPAVAELCLELLGVSQPLKGKKALKPRRCIRCEDPPRVPPHQLQVLVPDLVPETLRRRAPEAR